MKDGGFWAPGPASTPPPQTLLLEFQLPVSIVKRNFFFAGGSVQSEGNVDRCGIVRMLNPRARFRAALVQVSSVYANALTTTLATGFVGGSVNIRARVQMTLTANLDLNLHEPVDDDKRL